MYYILFDYIRKIVSLANNQQFLKYGTKYKFPTLLFILHKEALNKELMPLHPRA